MVAFVRFRTRDGELCLDVGLSGPESFAATYSDSYILSMQTWTSVAATPINSDHFPMSGGTIVLNLPQEDGFDTRSSVCCVGEASGPKLDMHAQDDSCINGNHGRMKSHADPGVHALRWLRRGFRCKCGRGYFDALLLNF
jgi:hypothetical protein